MTETKAKHTPDQTLSDALSAAGFTHQRDERTAATGKRVILRGDEIMGRFDAFEAWEWLNARAAIANAGGK